MINVCSVLFFCLTTQMYSALHRKSRQLVCMAAYVKSSERNPV
jgi:hypothetical protein